MSSTREFITRQEGVNLRVKYNVDTGGDWEQLGIYVENSDIDIYEILNKNVNLSIENAIENHIYQNRKL
ncbi:MAG: hypothetical protein HGA35_03565 [Erysipelotrichaceae bacterium]|nr:hypothetical protein [Erysipelotrichaceae bacterium]